MEDRLGNAEVDTAADLGRRHQPLAVMDVRRYLLNVRERWYHIMFHSRSPAYLSIMMNGVGRLLLPLSRITGVVKSSARLRLGLKLILLRFLTRLASCTGAGYRLMGRCITFRFLGSVHWIVDACGLGHFGISYLELIILFE